MIVAPAFLFSSAEALCSEAQGHARQGAFDGEQESLPVNQVV